MINLQNKISIGYNRGAQRFFDMLKQYKPYIHSVYFNPLFIFGEVYDYKEELKVWETINTHNIPLNIMFNWSHLYTFKTHEETLIVMDRFMERIQGIDSLTVVDQKTIDIFKSKYPNLKVHVSCMVNINTLSQLKKLFNIKDLYCVNLNSDNLFNFKFMDELHSNGIKVKLVSNQSCIYRHNEWSNYFFNKNTCGGGALHCEHGCYNTHTKENEWLNLTRQTYTKEFLPYYGDKLDIVKISTRLMHTEGIEEEIQKWTTDTGGVTFDNIRFKELPKEFIEKRISCDHLCKKCMFCKEIFDYYSPEVLPCSLPVTGIKR